MQPAAKPVMQSRSIQGCISEHFFPSYRFRSIPLNILGPRQLSQHSDYAMGRMSQKSLILPTGARDFFFFLAKRPGGKGLVCSFLIAICYGLDGPGTESRWGRDFPAPFRDWPCDPPSLLYNGYRVSFPGVK